MDFSDAFRLTPPQGMDVEVYGAPLAEFSLDDVPLADPNEVTTFVTPKRYREHMTGRWLLGEVLKASGVGDLSSVQVVRNEYRAPSLVFIQGVWKRTPLPNISIAHSGGHAFLAVSKTALDVGFDAEPLSRVLAENAYDMMAKSVELDELRASPEHAFQAWTGKEAVQKCLGKGMHINPREIAIPIGLEKSIISIENSKIELVYWKEKGYHLSLAVKPSTPSLNAEDELLEKTRLAMEANPLWGIGCKTQRNG